MEKDWFPEHMDIGKKQYVMFLLVLVIASVMTFFAFQSIKSEWVLFRKAETLFKAGDFAGSAVYYEGALSSGLKLKDARLRLGLAYVGAGNFEKATDTFKTIVSLAPDDRTAIIYLARVLTWSGRYEEAVKQYRTLLPDNTVYDERNDAGR